MADTSRAARRRLRLHSRFARARCLGVYAEWLALVALHQRHGQLTCAALAHFRRRAQAYVIHAWRATWQRRCRDCAKVTWEQCLRGAARRCIAAWQTFTRSGLERLAAAPAARARARRCLLFWARSTHGERLTSAAVQALRCWAVPRLRAAVNRWHCRAERRQVKACKGRRPGLPGLDFGGDDSEAATIVAADDQADMDAWCATTSPVPEQVACGGRRPPAGSLASCGAGGPPDAKSQRPAREEAPEVPRKLPASCWASAGLNGGHPRD